MIKIYERMRYKTIVVEGVKLRVEREMGKKYHKNKERHR